MLCRLSRYNYIIPRQVSGIGQVGYVANSYKTVAEDCYSTGRLYDNIGDEAQCTVRFKLNSGSVICSVDEESLLDNCIVNE